MMKLYIRNVWVIKFLSICIDLILSLWSEKHSSVKNPNILSYRTRHVKSSTSPWLPLYNRFRHTQFRLQIISKFQFLIIMATHDQLFQTHSTAQQDGHQKWFGWQLAFIGIIHNQKLSLYSDKDRITDSGLVRYGVRLKAIALWARSLSTSPATVSFCSNSLVFHKEE